MQAFAKKMVEKIKAGSCGVMKAEARKAGPQGPIDTNLALLLHNVVRQDDSKTLGIFQTKEAAMAAVDEEIVRSMGLHAVTNRPINNYMHLLGTLAHPAGNTAILYTVDKVPVSQFEGKAYRNSA